MPSKVRRNVSEATKKIVAGNQRYQCNNKPYFPAKGCVTHECLLWKNKINPGNFDAAGYEIDHIVGLDDGGNNNISNLQALCPNCHSFKTRNNNSSNNSSNNKIEIVEEMEVEDDIINIEIINQIDDYIIIFINKYILRSQKGKIGWVELNKKFIKWYGENDNNKYKKIPNKDLEKLFIDKLFKTNSKMIKIDNRTRKGWEGYKFK